MFCSHCGEELPRDDTRFCSNCGVVRAARIANPSSIAETGNSSPPTVVPPGNVEMALPGQGQMESRAPMPPLHMKSRIEGEEFPTWMSKLQHDTRNKQPLKDKDQQTISSQQQDRESQDIVARDAAQEYPGSQHTPGPAPVMHTTVRERSVQSQDASSPGQLEFPDLPATSPSFSSMRELRAVEDVPTQSVESVSVVQPPRANLPIDNIPTTPLLAMADRQPQSLHGQIAYSRPKSEQAPDNITDIAHMSTAQLQVQGQNQVASFVAAQVNQPLAQGGARAFVFRGPKSRLPFLIGAASVLLLLALALGSWIIIFQPFSVSPVTNLQQSYVDSRLGISLRYPNGWKTPQVDYGKKVITLLDASDTAQMNIQIADATAASLESYLQQQAAKLGFNNSKPGSVTTFADASWQQIQGDLQVKGAEYTCTLFSTVYKNHRYTLTQRAPRTIYMDEEKLVFSPTRLSLHFL